MTTPACEQHAAIRARMEAIAREEGRPPPEAPAAPLAPVFDVRTADDVSLADLARATGRALFERNWRTPAARP